MPESDVIPRAAALRDCEKQMLELANSGQPRLAFLRESVRSMTRSIGVAATRIVLFDSRRRFFVEAVRDADCEPLIDVRSEGIPAKETDSFTTGASPELEEICRAVMASRSDPSLPWYTDSGDFWVDDARAFGHWDLVGDKTHKRPGLSVSNGSQFVAIVPVEGARKRLGLIQFESPEAEFLGTGLREPIHRLVQTFGFAADLRGLQVALRERVKELTCLYGIAHLVAHAELSLNEVLQSAVDMLPPGWLYPEVAAARITLRNRSYATAGVDDMVQTMKADIIVDDVVQGLVEVGYTKKMPQVAEGPFLHEERHLLDTIARELSFVVEQKSYAEAKQKLQRQLRHADRLATIGQLAAGVAHELNEPLSTIMGFAQLAAKQENVSDEAVRDMNKIVSAALHARGVIKELLVFARETKPVKLSFSLNDLIRDGLYFLEARFVKAGISLQIHLDENLPEITADRSQILQVLTNLAVNAVQAMPNGGRLTITTLLEDDFVKLAVTDTGCGMDPDVLKDIFHPFFTTKDVSEGTGLGLSVVHGIVTAHNGYIEVDSRPGEGTRFSIRLPFGAGVKEMEA